MKGVFAQNEQFHFFATMFQPFSIIITTIIAFFYIFGENIFKFFCCRFFVCGKWLTIRRSRVRSSARPLIKDIVFHQWAKVESMLEGVKLPRKLIYGETRFYYVIFCLTRGYSPIDHSLITITLKTLYKSNHIFYLI